MLSEIPAQAKHDMWATARLANDGLTCARKLGRAAICDHSHALLVLDVFFTA